MKSAWIGQGKNTREKQYLLESKVVSRFSTGSLYILVELKADFMCKTKYLGIHIP